MTTNVFRSRAADVMVAVGAVFYVLGVVTILLGAPAEAKYPPFALSSGLWAFAWQIRP